jgi:hypothetical protein
VLLVFVVLIIKDGDVTITEINKQKWHFFMWRQRLYFILL